MLLKLIKYDFKEQLREHIGLYALVFVSALTEIILDSFEFDLVSVFFWALHSDDFYIFYSAVIKGIYHLHFKCIKPSGGCRSYEQSSHRCTCRIAASHSGVCRRLDIQYDKET